MQNGEPSLPVQVVTYLTQSRSSPASKEQVLAFTRAARVCQCCGAAPAVCKCNILRWPLQCKLTQELGLRTEEILQLINLRPQSEVELYLVGSHCLCYWSSVSVTQEPGVCRG